MLDLVKCPTQCSWEMDKVFINTLISYEAVWQTRRIIPQLKRLIQIKSWTYLVPEEEEDLRG